MNNNLKIKCSHIFVPLKVHFYLTLNSVLTTRKIQEKRFEKYKELHCNAHMPGKMVSEVCRLDNTGMTLLKNAMEKLQLSARAYDRILKVARTAADMGGSDWIRTEHVAQASQYRRLDREGWLG